MQTKPLSDELLDREAAAFDSRVASACSFLSSMYRSSITMFGWGESYIALSRILSRVRFLDRSEYESGKKSHQDLP